MATYTITILDKQEQDGDKAISDSGIPDAILTLPESNIGLTPDEVDLLRARWRQLFGYGRPKDTRIDL